MTRIEDDAPDGFSFNKVAVTVMAGLIGIGVAGIWSMSNSVAKLEERVASWSRTFETRMDRIDDSILRHGESINRLDKTILRNSGRLERIERDFISQQNQSRPQGSGNWYTPPIDP